MKLYIAIISLFLGLSLHAQTSHEWRDSISAARKVADKSGKRDAGTRIVKPDDFRTMVAATGEADVIKFIQTLPGVSSGGESSSAIYVRGGNLGSNLITLDGVPLYGASHLLGFTSAYPADIVEEAIFQVGGFTSEEGNLTASHIKLLTTEGDYNSWGGKASVSNFILGAKCSGPIVKDKLSLVAAARFSPIGPEFNLLRNVFHGALDSLDNVKAIVYDAYAKLSWRINSTNNLSASVFNSLDTYSYQMGAGSEDHMQWSNLLANVRHNVLFPSGINLASNIAFNRFSSGQGMFKILDTSENTLAIKSSIQEVTGHSIASGKLWKVLEWQGGLKVRWAQFNPGSSSKYKGGSLVLRASEAPPANDYTNAITSTLHGQVQLLKKDSYEFRAGGRLNYAHSHRLKDDTIFSNFSAEADLSAKYNLLPWLGVEATADWTTQYYHTLEGVPLGWSLDMIVPSGSKCPPEHASQYYIGAFAAAGRHSVSLGVYYKSMRNLVYFGDATKLFSSSVAGWEDNIDVGIGTSKGLELLYEYRGDRLSGRFAYTLSKTDRTFPNINNGLAFPAKFDRRHILNVTSEYIIAKTEKRECGVNALFVFQSGHWETVAAGTYYGDLLLGSGTQTVDYYSKTNNYEMPPYIRLDLGGFFRFGSQLRHQLNVGIYNVLNRHNPFMISYDSNSRSWKKISILPIMPSLCYSYKF